MTKEMFENGIRHLKLKLKESITENDKNFYRENLKYLQAMYMMCLVLNGIKYTELSKEEKSLLD